MGPTGLATHLLGLDLVLDVSQFGDHGPHRRVAQRVPADGLEPAPGAVAVGEPHPPGIGALRQLEHGLPLGEGAGHVVGVHQSGERGPDEGVDRPAEQVGHVQGGPLHHGLPAELHPEGGALLHPGGHDGSTLGWSVGLVAVGRLEAHHHGVDQFGADEVDQHRVVPAGWGLTARLGHRRFDQQHPGPAHPFGAARRGEPGLVEPGVVGGVHVAQRVFVAHDPVHAGQPLGQRRAGRGGHPHAAQAAGHRPGGDGVEGVERGVEPTIHRVQVEPQVHRRLLLLDPPGHQPSTRSWRQLGGVGGTDNASSFRIGESARTLPPQRAPSPGVWGHLIERSMPGPGTDRCVGFLPRPTSRPTWRVHGQGAVGLRATWKRLRRCWRRASRASGARGSLSSRPSRNGMSLK